jgi:hypothetical protein
MEFLTQNWEYILIAFYVAEKLVKMSPSKKDDILLDVVFQGLKRLVIKGK